MSNNISDKFKKELVNFFKWVEDANYTVLSKNGEDQEWCLSLCPDYIEPGRYKLIVFIENILINYNIHLDDTNIIDAKQMVTNFKNYKPKKEEKTKSPKKEKETKSPKKETKSPKKDTITINETEQLVNDVNLDTSCNGMLCELEFTTQQLENIFGCKAEFTGNEHTDHRYEWKFTFKNIVYSIYDWVYYDNSFDDYIDNEWFLGGDDENNIKLIKDLLNAKLLDTKSDAFIYDSDDE